MDKRYNALTLPEQLELRRKAVAEVLENPQWTLPQAVRHLRTTMRLTTAEMAKLAGISHRTLQDFELERSEGAVRTVSSLLGVVGLKLTVGRID